MWFSLEQDVFFLMMEVEGRLSQLRKDVEVFGGTENRASCGFRWFCKRFCFLFPFLAGNVSRC